jgi:hypothetical protein
LMDDASLEILYKEIGEHCPFKLARHLGIVLDYFDFGDEICGIYKSNDEIKHIFLNSAVDIIMQELACILLIKHHRMHPGRDRILSREDMQQFPTLEKVNRAYLKLLSNVFFNRTLGRA